MVLSALKASRRSNLSKRDVKRNRVDDDKHKNNVSDDEIEDEVLQLSQRFENISIATKVSN